MRRLPWIRWTMLPVKRPLWPHRVQAPRAGSSPGTCATGSWGGSLRAACWGTACATSSPEGLAGRDDLGKGWVAAQPLCSDLQSQRAMAVGWGKKRSENKSSIERRGGTVFPIGQHSFITSRDVMVNKLQRTPYFFFLLFCPSILKETECQPLIVISEDTFLLMRVYCSPSTPFTVQINFTRECSLRSVWSMYRKDHWGTARSLLTTVFPVIVKEPRACLQSRSAERWCHRCFFRCKIPVGHTGRSHKIKPASSAWLGVSVCLMPRRTSSSSCSSDETRECGREF